MCVPRLVCVTCPGAGGRWFDPWLGVFFLAVEQVYLHGTVRCVACRCAARVFGAGAHCSLAFSVFLALALTARCFAATFYVRAFAFVFWRSSRPTLRLLMPHLPSSLNALVH